MYKTPVIQIDNYNGPLDLLLSLIKDKKINIFDINLVEVANEYVKIIELLLINNDIDLISEYLVMAATLINLKAKILLKSPQEKKLVEKTKKSLLMHLSIYQKFKNIAEQLRVFELNKMFLHTKKRSNLKAFLLPIDETKLDGKGNPIHLIIIIRKMFERVYATKLKQTTIQNFNLSSVERRQELLAILNENNNPLWEKIFKVPSINHFNLTWITLLDMASKQELTLSQNTLFGQIKIRKGSINE